MKSTDFLKNKTVLITGGTGSFGRNFVEYLLKNSKVKKLIVFSRDEFKQFQMMEELKDERLRFFLGDIRDRERLARAFHGVDIVVHAAALKQVPALEYNPFEAVKTNVIGTQNVIEEAVDQGVDKVLLVSTDKAALPVSLYGATKLCAEKLFVSANSYSGNRVKFSAVRYGNVMGSRGSIIEKIIKTKKLDTVHITHEEMTRFWINLEQSFELVLFALQNMEGGEIFVPKIPSMKLAELFNVLAPGAKRHVIGIRPGEKIHEVLLSEEEACHAIELSKYKYYVILPENSEMFNIGLRFKKYFKIGRKLPPDFSYESHTNKEWLSNDDFRKFIEGLQKRLASSKNKHD
ncbi:MAG TPA: UDP-N-acetylglucosamine 4,6-dehydratase (inverting) [Candidatus Paceibacterota bacterium]